MSIVNSQPISSGENPKPEEAKELVVGTPKRPKKRYYVCAVANCPNPQDKRYHNFPSSKKFKDMQQNWVRLCKRADKFNPDNARICENHFSPAMIKRDFQHELLNLPLRFLLNPGAYPDQNLPKSVYVNVDNVSVPDQNIPASLPQEALSDSGRKKNNKTSCAVVSCKNPTGITYHLFPKDDDLSKVWLSKCGRQDSFKTKGKKVCSNHFTADDYDYNGFSGKSLKKGAIPSLKLNVGEDTIEVNDVGNNSSSNVIDDIDISYDDGVVTNETERSKRKVKKDHLRMANDVLLAEAKEKNEILDNVVSSLQRENQELKNQLRAQREADNNEIKSLKEKLAASEKKNKRLNTQNSRLRRVAEKSKIIKKKELNSKVKEVLSTRMSPGNVKMYLNPEKKWVRYSNRDKVEALVLSAISKKGYKQLRQFNQLTLPAVSTIRGWLSEFQCRPGYQEDAIRVISVMNEKAKMEEKMKHYEMSALAFDEVDLKKNHWAIDMKYQRVYPPAKKCNTVVIRGLVQH